jgi:hypothetical protein
VALTDSTQQPPTLWGWHNRDYTVMNPYASTPPAVSPGEHDQGPLPSGESIWHFQDDAVSGVVAAVVFDPKSIVLEQSAYDPQDYVPPFDGPSSIIEHSKDLAFELYYVPEPGTLGLLAVGLALVAAHRRRRRG